MPLQIRCFPGLFRIGTGVSLFRAQENPAPACIFLIPEPDYCLTVHTDHLMFQVFVLRKNQNLETEAVAGYNKVA